MNDSLERLYEQVIGGQDRRSRRMSRTAKLMRAGRAKMAKKLAEEAIEVVIDAMNGEREAVVRESADLLYNLVVLWAEAGIRPQEVFAEMARRERLFGLAEKLPKKHVETSGRRKVVMLEVPPQIPPALGPRPPLVDKPAQAARPLFESHAIPRVRAGSRNCL